MTLNKLTRENRVRKCAQRNKKSIMIVNNENLSLKTTPRELSLNSHGKFSKIYFRLLQKIRTKPIKF